MSEKQNKIQYWQKLHKNVPESLLRESLILKNNPNLIKQSPVRKIYRIFANNSSAILKIYLKKGIKQSILRRLMLDAPSREIRAIRTAKKNGLPAPLPLAVYKNKTLSMLLLEDLGSVITLSRIVDQDELNKKKIRNLAKALAIFHKKGFYHSDLHSENIVFTQNQTWIILDFQSIKLNRIFLFKKKNFIKDLIGLWFSLRNNISIKDILIFLKQYLYDTKSIFHQKPKIFFRRLAPLAVKTEKILLSKKENRCFRECSEFGVIKNDIYDAYYTKKITSFEAKSIIKDIVNKNYKIIKSGRRGFVAKNEKYFFKERDKRHAKKLWLSHYRMSLRDMPSIPAYMLVIFGKRGVIVTKNMRGYIHADDFLTKEKNPIKINNFILSLVLLVKKLHTSGLRNRDLKCQNLILKETAKGYDILFSDLDGIMLPKNLTKTYIFKDILRLCKSLNEFLNEKFIMQFLHETEYPFSEIKEKILEILKKEL